MRTNTKTIPTPVFTHEGAVAYKTNAEQQLRRTVMACLLWEDSFYESGQAVAERISDLVKQVAPEKVAQIAIEARGLFKLRHVPLKLVVEMAKLKTHAPLVAATTEAVVQRADELAELLSIYAAANKRTGTKKLNKLSKQLQKGLASAFQKFDEYSLAKYNQQNDVKLRDVLFLTHARPKNAEQKALWQRLINNELAVPDTWEVAISAAKGSKDATLSEWTRLLDEKKLGALALLRNLRNMREAGVDLGKIRQALSEIDVTRVLPFRFISAAKYNPQLEPEIEQAMFRALEGFPKLPGRTAVVVDNSGSMYGTPVSAKSDIDRVDAAAALAILVREVCEHATVIGYGSTAAVLPARRGFALRDAIKGGPGGGTNTNTALALARQQGYDRIIVLTDEQSHQTIGAPASDKAYFINVATYQNGIGYGKWTHIDGWSEAVLQYIIEAERA